MVNEGSYSYRKKIDKWDSFFLNFKFLQHFGCNTIIKVFIFNVEDLHQKMNPSIYMIFITHYMTRELEIKQQNFEGSYSIICEVIESNKYSPLKIIN